MDYLSIPDFFKNKEIFITGGSGFIGKTLIEKLLRNCADFKIIYLLIREMKGKTVDERVKEVLDNALFDGVRQSNPELLKKVVGISGDVSELKLGLSKEDRVRLRGVHVVFHAAASVRFDDPLRIATLMNIRGTREVMELMLEMSCLEVGVHVSTTYCNTDKDVIEERLYRDHGDWREAIRIAEQYQDDYKVACLTEKYIGNLKNTYLVSKHLAENVTEDYSDRLPLIIYRPGIVVSMWKDPLPGWVDNVYGPIGMTVAIGKGLLRVANTDPERRMDDMPVDIVVRGLIMATWKRGIQRQPQELTVYNCSMQGHYHKTQRQIEVESLDMVSKYPYNGMMWYPTCELVKNKPLFRIKFLLFNVILAIIADAVLLLTQRKPKVTKLTRKVYFVLMSISYFVQRNWDFKCEKFWDLNNHLKESDREAFLMNLADFSLLDFMMNARMGTSKFILNEEIDIPSALKMYKWLKILHYSLKYLLCGFVLYFVVSTRYFRSIMI